MTAVGSGPVSTRLPEDVLAQVDEQLSDTDALLANAYPGEDGRRQPVHTVYVPADQYTPDLPQRWGREASALVAEHGGIERLIWTEARRRGLRLEQVVDWMASKPAQRVRLPAKGKLALGYDADLAVVAPDQAFVVDAANLYHKNPITPYQGRTLSGVVRRTFVRGREVNYTEPHGRLLRRGQV